MKKLVRDIVKSTLLFGAVGLLLAASAPILGSLFGAGVLGTAAFEAATHTPILWTGVFFGAFGALVETIKPVINYAFGERSAPAAAEKSAGKETGYSHQVEQYATDHAKKLAARRATALTEKTR